MADERATQVLQDPQAEIERHLDAVLQRTNDDAKPLPGEASRYASAQLSEIKARARDLHELHGTP